MSDSKKLLTAFRLIARGEFRMLRRQFQRHRRTRRLRVAGTHPFIHRTAGHRLVCFPDVPDSALQYLHGGDDHWEIALLRRWLEPGDAFVDAGANLGLYSHAVADHFSGTVEVLALEASPYLADRMMEAVRLLGERNVTTVSVAVGGEPGNVSFFLARPGCTTVSQSLQIDPADAADYEQHARPMRTLANLAASYLPGSKVMLVKVDIEGAEPLALRGASPTWLRPDGPLWLVEINLSVLARLGFAPYDVLHFFPTEVFSCWILPKFPRAGCAPARARMLQSDEQFADAAFYNLIAIPNGVNTAQRRVRISSLLA